MTRARVRVYDSTEIARDMRETFTAKRAKEAVHFPFQWPRTMQHVGDSLAVAYSSDKWTGKMTPYKHLAESHNRALCVPGFLRDFDDAHTPWPTIGPTVSFADLPMPKTFAILALFEEIDLRLHTRGTNEHPQFARDADDGVVKVTVAHGMLGGAKILWSEKYDYLDDEPFLFIYDEKSGPLAIVVGDELDVQKEGITG